MKKLFLFIICFLIYNSYLKAQEFRRYRIGGNLGLGVSTINKESFIYKVEGLYRKDKKLSGGLKYEKSISRHETENVKEVFTISSVATIYNYHFSGKTVNPYVGVGLGIYSFLQEETSNNYTSGITVISYGISPRVGFDMGHLNFNIGFNIAPNNFIIIGISKIGEPTINDSYVSISLGGFLGGGIKNKSK